MYNPPDIASFKAQFDRDFPYGTTSETVKDFDITKALFMASFNMNEAAFGDQNEYQFVYNILAAHWLVMNLKGSSQGINGGFSWLESSKSVGSVSQSFTIPEDILKNPLYASMSKTTYGAEFLSIMIPKTYGAVMHTEGGTQI